MYTEEELKEAFEAGENLAWHEAGEYEGYTDNIEVDYKNFEEWLHNFIEKFKDV
jgi:hypothetical protein